MFFFAATHAAASPQLASNASAPSDSSLLASDASAPTDSTQLASNASAQLPQQAQYPGDMCPDTFCQR